MFSLKTGLLFVFLASSAIQICFYLGKVRLFGDAPDRKTISSLYASHVCGLTAPLGNDTLQQKRKAELWLCPAVTPEKLKPGQRGPCAPGPTSKRVAHIHFLPSRITGTNGFSGVPLSWSDILCAQRWRKGVLKHKRGILNLIPHLKEKLTYGSEQQHYLALESSGGEQRCVWDVSLTKGSNLGSSVSSQFFQVTGQIIGTIVEFPPYLAMEE